MSKGKRLCLILAAWMSGVASISLAEERSTIPQSLPAQLNEAINVALGNRVEIALAAQEKVTAASKVNVAKGYFLPSISLTGSSKYINYIDTYTSTEANVPLGEHWYHVTMQNNPPSFQSNAGLELSYNIYSGGQNTAGLKEAKAEYDAIKHQETATKQRISREVINSYWSLRKSQIESRIAERNYLYATKRLLISQAKRKSDLSSAIDTETEMLSVKEAEIAVADARSNEARELSKYREILGISDSAPRHEATDRVTLTDDPDMVSDTKALPTADRPEILQLQAELLAAENRVKKSEADYLPQIDFKTSYTMVGRDENEYVQSVELASEAYQAGISFSFTIFDGFKDRVALARSEQETARLRILDKIRQLEIENNDQTAEKEQLQNEVNLALQRQKLSDTKMHLARQKFAHGEIAEIDLTEAVKNYENLSDNLLIAKIDSAIAKQILSMGN